MQTMLHMSIDKEEDHQDGLLPPKEAEVVPWETLCIDLIGPYSIDVTTKRGAKKTLTLWCLTMIDPATGWFEIQEIASKHSDFTANYFEQAWLLQYPWPTQVVMDRG